MKYKKSRIQSFLLNLLNNTTNLYCSYLKCTTNFPNQIIRDIFFFSGSGVLLPNPFAKILQSTPVLHRTKELNNISVSSPSILPSTVVTIKNSCDSPEKLLTNSQSSDSSDLLIIEDPPPPLIEVIDTATQQLLEPYSQVKTINEEENKYDDILPTDVITPINTDGMTSDDTDIDVENLELPPSKKKKKENMHVQENVPQQSPTDSDSGQKIRFVSRNKNGNFQRRNGYRFDSTDDESEAEEIQRRTVRKRIARSSNHFLNQNLETAETSMKFNVENESIIKLKSVCLICQEYFPNIDTHITDRHGPTKSQTQKCRNCSKKFYSKSFLDLHSKMCNSNCQN